MLYLLQCQSFVEPGGENGSKLILVKMLVSQSILEWKRGIMTPV